MKTATTDTASLNAALHKALAHPLRGQILVLLDEVAACPTEIAERLDEPFDRVAWHVRELAKLGVIELVDTDTRRGGKQHFYKTVVRPFIPSEVWEEFPKLLREVNSGWTALQMLGDLRAALEMRTFDAQTERAMLRMHAVVDQQGLAEICDAAVGFLEAVHDAQARSCERRATTKERGVRVSTSALAYEIPPSRE